MRRPPARASRTVKIRRRRRRRLRRQSIFHRSALINLIARASAADCLVVQRDVPGGSPPAASANWAPHAKRTPSQCARQRVNASMQPAPAAAAAIKRVRHSREAPLEPLLRWAPLPALAAAAHFICGFRFSSCRRRRRRLLLSERRRRHLIMIGRRDSRAAPIGTCAARVACGRPDAQHEPVGGNFAPAPPPPEPISATWAKYRHLRFGAGGCDALAALLVAPPIGSPATARACNALS